MESTFPWDAVLTYSFRWIHYVAGVCWIGLLYFLNLVNTVIQPKFKDAGITKQVVPELMPRVLFWFRWAAMFTFLSGLIYVYLAYMKGNPAGHVAFFGTSHGVWILIGMLFATIMWFNVWFVIWPTQRKIINGVKSGNPAPPELPKRALLFSRINTYLSVPMLFLMGAGKHLGAIIDPRTVEGFALLIAIIAIGELVVWFAITQSSKISTEV